MRSFKRRATLTSAEASVNNEVIFFNLGCFADPKGELAPVGS
jgi:hypothetical protein